MATTALLVSTVGVTGTLTPTTITASSWHRGLPKAMVGTWKTKHLKLKLTRTSKLFGQKPEYKYLGHQHYLVTTIPNGSKFAVKVTKHHLTINNVTYYK